MQDEFRAATNTLFDAKERLQNAEANKSLLDPVQYTSLQDQYDASIKLLKAAKLRQKDIRKVLEKATATNDHLPGLTNQKLSQSKYKFNLYLLKHRRGQTIPPVPKEPVPSETNTVSANMNSYSTPTSEQNLAPDPSMYDKIPIHRQASAYPVVVYECNYLIDTIYRQTKQKRILLGTEPVFTHTDPDLRPHFKNKDLITCTGQVSQTGDYIDLILHFQIASTHSQNNFGALEEGSFLRLRLMD